MAAGNVRSIDSLRRLGGSLGRMAGDWDDALHQIRTAVRRVEEHYCRTVPAYWRRQTEAAEAALTEANYHLSSLQPAAGRGTAPATEAQQRVAAARRRVELCRRHQQRAKAAAAAVERECSKLSGPIAEVALRVEAEIPRAAAVLKQLVGHLDRYAEIAAPAAGPASERPPEPPATNDGNRPA